MSSGLPSSSVNASTTAKATVFVPCGESRSGSYGATLGQLHAGYVEPVHSKLFTLAVSIPFVKVSVFSIGDYGTADGGSSMVFLRRLLEILKERHGPDAQFQIIHEDQDQNDYNSLFRRLTGISPYPPPHLLMMDNVYAFASGTDFYKQCVPSNSMHFIVCMMSVHWLSQPPTVYRDSIYVSNESQEEEKKALRKQAQIDWENFLLMRSRELKEGGILFLGAPASYVAETTCQVRFSAERLVTLITDVWKLFRVSGKITSQEFINTNISFCLRSIEQIREPFEEEKSQIVASGLRLLSSEIIISKNIYYSSWRQKKGEKGIDDREEFAEMMVSVHRNWSNHSFMAGLSDTSSLEERKQIVDDVYHNVIMEIALMNPELFKDDFLYSICFDQESADKSIIFLLIIRVWSLSLDATNKTNVIKPHLQLIHEI